MKRSYLSLILIFAFVSVSFCFAQEQGKNIQEYLVKDFPYEFVARMNLEEGLSAEFNSRSEALVSGVDIWFKPHWKGLPKAFHDGVLKVDVIQDNNIFVNFICDSAKENDYFYNFSGEPATLLGCLNPGDYVIVLSAVDEAGEFSATPMEIPFTVKENPVSVPCGLVRVSGTDGHIRGKEIVNFSDYIPDFTITAEGDSLHVVGWLNYTCCMDHYCYYEIYEDSVYIETVQAGYYEQCDCQGLHYVDFKFGPYQKTESVCAACAMEYKLGLHTLYFDLTPIALPEADSLTAPESVYDLQGRPADDAQKGIIVKDGKKMLIK